MAWQSIGHGMGGYPQAFAVAPTDPARCYLGIDVGCPYRSDDGGQSWTCIGAPLAKVSHLAQRQIIRIAVSHQDPDVAYFLTMEMGIWRTNDAGRSYSQVGMLQNTGAYHSGHLAAVLPTDHNVATFYAAGQFWYTDDGETLWPIPMPAAVTSPVATAAIASADGSNRILWVGSENTLYRLQYGDTGWNACQMIGFPAGKLSVGEMSGRPLWATCHWQTAQPILIALASDRIAYISLDLGDHWAKVPNSPPVAAPASLWVDPYDSARMAVNTHPQVGFITADGGQTGWVPSVASIEQSRRAEQAGMIEMHAYEFGRDHVIWGREGYSLYRSEDDGQRFKVCSQIRLGTQHYSSTGCEATFANWVAVDPAGRVFHSDQDCGLALSDDQMQSWHCLRYAVNEGNQSDHPSMRGKSVWNTDSTAGMIFDQGYTYAWITGRTIMQSELERFEYIWNADVVGSTLKERHNIYRSTDGELFEFWSYYNAFPWQWNSLSGNLIMDPVSPQAARTFYLAVPSGIWKSTDGAKRWTEVSPPRKGALPAYTNRYNWNRQPSLFAHVRIDPTESKRLFATTVKRVNPPVTSTSALSAIYVSQDRALSWKTVVSPIRSCWALEIAANGWVWAADRDSGLYLSRDSGGTWEHKLSLAFITSIVPLGDAVYVASDAGYRTMPDAGVYRSSSNGATWEEITHDLPHLRIMSMSTDGQRIFVGTRGAGAFVLNP